MHIRDASRRVGRQVPAVHLWAFRITVGPNSGAVSNSWAALGVGSAPASHHDAAQHTHASADTLRNRAHMAAMEENGLLRENTCASPRWLCCRRRRSAAPPVRRLCSRTAAAAAGRQLAGAGRSPLLRRRRASSASRWAWQQAAGRPRRRRRASTRAAPGRARAQRAAAAGPAHLALARACTVVCAEGAVNVGQRVWGAQTPPHAAARRRLAQVPPCRPAPCRGARRLQDPCWTRTGPSGTSKRGCKSALAHRPAPTAKALAASAMHAGGPSTSRSMVRSAGGRPGARPASRSARGPSTRTACPAALQAPAGASAPSSSHAVPWSSSSRAPRVARGARQPDGVGSTAAGAPLPLPACQAGCRVSWDAPSTMPGPIRAGKQRGPLSGPQWAGRAWVSVRQARDVRVKSTRWWVQRRALPPEHRARLALTARGPENPS